MKFVNTLPVDIVQKTVAITQCFMCQEILSVSSEFSGVFLQPQVLLEKELCVNCEVELAADYAEQFSNFQTI